MLPQLKKMSLTQLNILRAILLILLFAVAFVEFMETNSSDESGNGTAEGRPTTPTVNPSYEEVTNNSQGINETAEEEPSVNPLYEEVNNNSEGRKSAVGKMDGVPYILRWLYSPFLFTMFKNIFKIGNFVFSSTIDANETCGHVGNKTTTT